MSGYGKTEHRTECPNVGQRCQISGEVTKPLPPHHSSPEVIWLVVMMYVRFPLSVRNAKDLLFERGIDICYVTVRYWWNRFGPMFAGSGDARNHVNEDASEVRFHPRQRAQPLQSRTASR